MSPTSFRELADHELQRLSDDDLLAYMRRARQAGVPAASKRGLAHLAFGYRDNVRARVRIKMPPQLVDEIADRVVMSAIQSAFDGSSQGEFRAWMHQIVARRIADHYRRHENDPQLVSLDFNPDDEWGPELATESEGTTLDVDRGLAHAYGELSPEHARAVDLYVFEDLPAGEVAAATGLSEANIHQIASRFRRRLKELLEQGDTSP